MKKADFFRIFNNNLSTFVKNNTSDNRLNRIKKTQSPENIIEEAKNILNAAFGFIDDSIDIEKNPDAVQLIWEAFNAEISDKKISPDMKNFLLENLKRMKVGAAWPSENLNRGENIRQPRQEGEENKYIKNTENVEVYKKTKEISENGQLPNGVILDKKLTENMIKNTVSYTSNSVPLPKPGTTTAQTEYIILDQDSFVVANAMIKKGGFKPAVLNMANKISCGGGVEIGTGAQEETLFRCSNYWLALYQFAHKITDSSKKLFGRYVYNNQIPEFGCFYTPGVQVFRDGTKDYAYIAPFAVDCIAIAGYDLGKPHLYEATLRKNGDPNGAPLEGEELKKAFKNGTKEKIRLYFNAALANGNDSVVCGAISCGAFRLPNDGQGTNKDDGETARLVSEAYQEVLQEKNYANQFKSVVFAVYTNKKTSEDGVRNYQTFDKMVKNLENNKPQPQPQSQMQAKPLSFSNQHQVKSEEKLDEKSALELVKMFKKKMKLHAENNGMGEEVRDEWIDIFAKFINAYIKKHELSKIDIGHNSEIIVEFFKKCQEVTNPNLQHMTERSGQVALEVFREIFEKAFNTDTRRNRHDSR